jgi:adenylosuccinate lyase
VLADNAEVTAILPAQQLALLFDPNNYLGSAETFIEAVLAAAEPQAEPAIKSTVTG